MKKKKILKEISFDAPQCKTFNTVKQSQIIICMTLKINMIEVEYI